MIEKLEEELDYILVLKAATHFYFDHLKTKIEELSIAVRDLEPQIKQAAEVTSYLERTNHEISTFIKERDNYKAKLKEFEPYIDIIDKIHESQEAIRKKEKLIDSKHKVLLELKKNAARQQDNEAVQTNIKSSELDFQRDKTYIEIEIDRLVESIKWQRTRLDTMGVKEDNVTENVKRLNGKIVKFQTLIDQKKEAVSHYTTLLKQINAKIDKLKSASIDLQGLHRENNSLQEVMSIINSIDIK